MTVSIIVAVSQNGVIGKDNDLPWHLPNDMDYFKSTTKGHHVLTGRKNYESIPERFRPLPNRTNIVVTRNKQYDAPGAEVVTTIETGIEMARNGGESELFIMGGGQIYAEALFKGLVDRLYITRIATVVEGDVRFPDLDRSKWKLVESVAHAADAANAYDHTFETYERAD